MRDDIEIKLQIKRIKDLAILVSDGRKTAWLPKSKLNWDENYAAGQTITLAVPRWMAMRWELGGLRRMRKMGWN